MNQCIYDKHRIQLKNQLSELFNDITFCNFLMDPANTHHFQVFLLLCAGFYNQKEIDAKLAEIVSDYKFYQDGNYTYSQIIQLNREWYDFFKENVYPCGRKRINEQRRGVSRDYVDEINKICQKLDVSIEQAIIIWKSLRHKNFCIKNVINPYYVNPC